MHIETTPAEFAELLALTAAAGAAAPTEQPRPNVAETTSRHLQARAETAEQDREAAQQEAADLRAEVTRLTRDLEVLHRANHQRVRDLHDNRAAWGAAAKRKELRYLPDFLGADPGPLPPPEHVRHWCADNPLPQPQPAPEPEAEGSFEDAPPAAPTFETFTRPKPGPRPKPTPAEPASAVQPARFSDQPIPDLGIRLLTPAEREAKATERAAEAAAGVPEHVDSRRLRTGARGMPLRIGQPGANLGDGLDIWRVDGRELLNDTRRAARAAGATPQEAAKVRSYGDADYARLIQRLEEVQDDGCISDHTAALAVIVGRTRESIYGPLKRAHELGVSTEPVRTGRLGTAQPVPQRLTDYGRSLLGDGPQAPPAADTPDAAEEAPAEADLPPLDSPPPLTEPTAEQQAEIDRLNAENAAHVQRTRAGSRGVTYAVLPRRTRPVTNRFLPKDLRKPAAVARRNGWAIGVGKSGHIEWHGPNGELVRTAATPSAQGTINHAHRDLRAAGISW